MDQGTKLARIRTCQTCEHRRSAHASVWRWPHCVHDEMGDELMLDNEFMEGPDANCPAGRWQGLAPVDVKAETVGAQDLRAKAERERVGPILAALLEGQDEQETIRRLLLVVKAGMVSPAVADEIAEGTIRPATLEDFE